MGSSKKCSEYFTFLLVLFTVNVFVIGMWYVRHPWLRPYFANDTSFSQVTLDAFGERYDLNLEKNEDLMADQFDIFYADPAEDGRTTFQRAVEVRILIRCCLSAIGRVTTLGRSGQQHDTLLDGLSKLITPENSFEILSDKM